MKNHINLLKSRVPKHTVMDPHYGRYFLVLIGGLILLGMSALLATLGLH